MRSQYASTYTGRQMATQRHSDVLTSFRQVPAVHAAECIALAPWLLPFCLLSVTWNLSTAPTWERGRGRGEMVTLDLSVFPSKSGLLFISNDAETVKHDLWSYNTILWDCKAPTCTLNIHQHIHGLLISTLTWLLNQDKWLGTLNIISM